MTESSPSEVTDRHAEFMRLFVASERRIYAYIRSLVAHRADAENVLQETAVVLWQKFSEYQTDTPFVRWALAIARFKVLSFCKQHRRDAVVFSERLIQELEPTSAEIAEQPLEMRDALEACLAALPPADQALFFSRYQEGATVPKLAVRLGRPATTIYHALDRIRRLLVACVERRLRAEGAR